MLNFFRTFFLFLATISTFLIASEVNYSIVFIHIGKQIPDYLEIAVSQARLFNQDCKIFVIANQEAIDEFSLEQSDLRLTLIACETLRKTEAHQKFLTDRSPSHFREGFWNITSERFLYLHDFFIQYQMMNVFHLEYDNMLYVDLKKLLPIFLEKYKGIAATFDNDERAIAGFIYIPNSESMGLLANFFAKEAGKNCNDMEILASFKNIYGKNQIDYLPIVMDSYSENNTLVSTSGLTVKNKENFSNHVDLFQSLFDAAAIGQYLGGIDPRNGNSVPGYINTSCVFNPSLLKYEWHLDQLGRNVPYAIYGEKKYRINNLHIHSKDLIKFSSGKSNISSQKFMPKSV